MTIELRGYQQDAKNGVRQAFLKRFKRVLLVGACGFGKTMVVGSMIESAREKSKRILFLVDRIALVNQTSQRLHEAGIPHGVIQGDRSFGRMERVLVCSMQTLEKRGFIDDADLVILDEAHTIRTKTMEMLSHMDIYVIGLTATPMTAGLSEFYQIVVNGASQKMLQDQGWLVSPKVYVATEIDMSQARLSGGEWTAESASSCAIPILGDIATEWVTHTEKEFGGAVKTLVFVPTVAFGHDLCRKFGELGYRFEQVSYRNDPDVNRTNIDSLRRGSVDGLVSVEALVKGLDIPDVMCLVSARPYKRSLANHIQQTGRLLRAFPGKEFGLLLDHSGNWLRFIAEAEAFWNTGDWDLLWNEKKMRKRRDDERVESKERKCLSCGFVLEPKVKICPACGYEMPVRKPNEVVSPATMKLYQGRGGSDMPNSEQLWKALSTCALNRHGQNMEKAKKFALAQYKNITGVWPKSNGLDLSGYYNDQVELMVEENIRAYVRKLKRQKAMSGGVT